MTLKFWKKGSYSGGALAHTLAAVRGRKMLGAYEVERELGRGSMGIVYLGREPGSGREVAIKTVNLQAVLGQDNWEEARERYVFGVKTLAGLYHPDIVKYYDVWEEQGGMYVAMEYLGGVELTEYEKPGHLLPLADLLGIIARVADALGYTHGKLIVHRDIKPANIMYDAARDQVKLVDFGIARPVNHAATRQGVVVGSPPYMSPEQVLGKLMDGRSDLFALGSTFFRLATGRLPFEADSEFTIMYKIVQDAPLDIASLRPDIPGCVRAVVERALAKDVGQRFQSGHEMAEAMRRCRAEIAG
jgi:serine/threonine protein kinase